MTAECFKNEIKAAPNRNMAPIHFRLFFIIAIFFIIAVWMDFWIRGELGVREKVMALARDKWGISVLAAGGLIYLLLLSLPFVPGVELGILLMCAFGKEGIIFVYAATVSGLVIAFLMGRMLPKKWADAMFEKFGIARTGDNRTDGLSTMISRFFHGKKRLCTSFFRYRYLAIAILLNLPGNYLIGGGGGISFTCGNSRNISFKLFLLTVVLAVAPVPLLALLGVIQLEDFLYH